MDFGTVGILGVGLLGGSLGKALKARDLCERVIGIGRNKERLQLAQTMGAVDDITIDMLAVAPELDILVVAVPVSLIPVFVAKITDSLKPNAVITDVGSTKAKLVRDCETSVEGKQVFFVGSHPMAGGEKTGVASSREDIFEGATCFVTPTASSKPEAESKIVQLWESVGGKVFVLSPDEHDQIVAASSHLPHLVASALCLIARKEHSSLPHFIEGIGSGFRDATRIAAGSELIWKDICTHNRENIVSCLTRFGHMLDAISHAIDAQENQEVERLLRDGRVFREML